MIQNFSSDSQLSITPLGAGDLIDRAVRFYRNNFWTLIFIASPPIILGTFLSVIWKIMIRYVLGDSSSGTVDATFLSVFFIWIGAMVIWFIETVAMLCVMGGASRNFVRHLLFGEAITVRETYANLRARTLGLISASALLTFILGFCGLTVFYFGLFIVAIVVMLIFAAFSFSQFLAFLLSIIAGVALVLGALWIFFLIASRFAYVPQVMLVEGQGVFDAIGRSASLASGNVKRLAALFVFTLVATYSALALFYVPLGWYAYANGLEIFSSNPDAIPAWYQIASEVVGQLSLILLMPVWMIGLCLLYVDERVRHEGYDIELLAARRLGEIPALPQDHASPLRAALGETQPPAISHKHDSGFTTLGLK